MRRSPAAAAVLPRFAVFAIVLALTAGCDQLNKPLSTSSSSSSSSSGSSAAPAADAGDGEDGGAPQPAFTAQPGDIQL